MSEAFHYTEIKTRNIESRYITFVGVYSRTARRNGYGEAVPEHQYETGDEVTVEVPWRDGIMASDRDTTERATVSGASMSDRSPEHAMAYANLLMRAAAYAAMLNSERYFVDPGPKAGRA